MYFFGRSISEKYSKFSHFVLMKRYIERLTFMGMVILNNHVTPHLNIVTCFYLKLSLKNNFRFLGNAENFELLELF